MRMARSWTGGARRCGHGPLCVTAYGVGDLCGDTERRPSRLDANGELSRQGSVGSAHRSARRTDSRAPSCRLVATVRRFRAATEGVAT